jgi:hypothetical protein
MKTFLLFAVILELIVVGFSTAENHPVLDGCRWKPALPIVFDESTQTNPSRFVDIAIEVCESTGQIHIKPGQVARILK